MTDALAHARAVQLAAASTGFDWPDVSGALDKLREEVDEFSRAVRDGTPARQREELGDIFFSAVNVSRFIGVDPAAALCETSRKFESRFERVCARIEQSGRTVGQCSLPDLDAVWEAVKGEENGEGVSAP